MIKRYRFTKILFTLTILTLWTIAATAAPLAKHVFIISIDGGAPYVMKESQIPVLQGMLEGGAGTWEAQTVFPSVTLIAHTSMITGVDVDKHGVTWNGSDHKRPLDVTTCFVEAKAKYPSIHTAFFTGKDKLFLFAKEGSIDHQTEPAYETEDVTKLAADYIRSNKPNLSFVHFAKTDGLGHQHKWGSDEQKAGFNAVDTGIGELWAAVEEAGIADETVFIITADHGGHDNTHGSKDPKDMTIPFILSGKGVKEGYTITDEVKVYDSSATALWLLDVEIPESFDGKAITSAFNFD